MELRLAMQNKWISGWTLFWMLSLLISSSTLLAMLPLDMSQPESVSHMISYSVRWAVPFIYIVVAASTMPVMFPGAISSWWLRNRKFLGLVFAVAMAWQGAFIFTMSAFFTDYYYSDVYLLRDELEGSCGYLFLAAMVFTSFRFSRKHLTQSQWKLLHRSGIYFLWAYPFSVYWWNVFYYQSDQVIDHVFYWLGFLAFALRIAAWGKKRRAAGRQLQPDATLSPLPRVLGLALIALGLVASATGQLWQDSTSTFLLSAAWSARLELWLPFWPLQPFLPLFTLALGAWCLTASPSPTHITQKRTA